MELKWNIGKPLFLVQSLKEPVTELFLCLLLKFQRSFRKTKYI